MQVNYIFLLVRVNFIFSSKTSRVWLYFAGEVHSSFQQFSFGAFKMYSLCFNIAFFLVIFHSFLIPYFKISHIFPVDPLLKHLEDIDISISFPTFHRLEL